MLVNLSDRRAELRENSTDPPFRDRKPSKGQVDPMRFPWIAALLTISVVTSPATSAVETTRITRLEAAPGLKTHRGKLYEPARITVVHQGGEVRASLKVGGEEPKDLRLEDGTRDVDLLVPDVDRETP